MGFTANTAVLKRSLQGMDRRRLYAQEIYGRAAAMRLAGEARAGAPWRDHTGHARGGITGRSERRGPVFIITLSGSVHYLTYLELAHGKKWAILWPTLQLRQREILNQFMRLGGLR